MSVLVPQKNRPSNPKGSHADISPSPRTCIPQVGKPARPATRRTGHLLRGAVAAHQPTASRGSHGNASSNRLLLDGGQEMGQGEVQVKTPREPKQRGERKEKKRRARGHAHTRAPHRHDRHTSPQVPSAPTLSTLQASTCSWGSGRRDPWGRRQGAKRPHVPRLMTTIVRVSNHFSFF